MVEGRVLTQQGKKTAAIKDFYQHFYSEALDSPQILEAQQQILNNVPCDIIEQ